MAGCTVSVGELFTIASIPPSAATQQTNIIFWNNTMQYMQIFDKKQHAAVTYDGPVISLGEEFLYVSGITYLALLTTLTVLSLVFSTAVFYPTSILDAGRSNPVPTGPCLPFLCNGGPGAPGAVQLVLTCYRYLRAVHIAPNQNCMKQILANKTTGPSLRPGQRQSSLQTFGRNNTTTAEHIITARISLGTSRATTNFSPNLPRCMGGGSSIVTTNTIDASRTALITTEIYMTLGDSQEY